MICKKCNRICRHIGATIGGAKLYACPKCKTVYSEG